MLFLIIILNIFLIISIICNILLWKAGEKQMIINEIYIEWISDWKSFVFKTYAHMKFLDEKQIFEKDDEVGIVFQNMTDLIKNLNEKTEEIFIDKSE